MLLIGRKNLQPHQAYLTTIGAWPFYVKAAEAAQLVRHLLGERAKTKGDFVKGEMKTARRATDKAIAELYKVLMALDELMPTEDLTALMKQLKGIELYAKQYYLPKGKADDDPTPEPEPQPEPDGGSDVTPVQPEA